MTLARRALFVCGLSVVAVMISSAAFAQSPFPSAKALKISAADRTAITERLDKLQAAVATLKVTKGIAQEQIADVEIFAKAGEWILRHGEFYRPNYAKLTIKALDTGLKRAVELQAGKPSWLNRPGSSIRGYYSRVDGSVQPYALSLPAGVDPKGAKRYPLHVKLHGRGGTLNEVSFINSHEGKPLGKDQTWVQLDIFGRINNAYRWSGETDVFEAIADLNRAARIDDRRVVLHGFSMGGAGAWSLGLHHPSKWCSVGPGAGFVDFYQYQNKKEKLPEYQDKTLGIYDSIDYILNAADVPVCTYGGELDKQLVASTRMVEAAKKLGIDMKFIIGKGAGHKFTPEGFKEFMAFHVDAMKKGRAPFPGRKSIRFTTRTLKYNQCEWATIEEMFEMYKPAKVEGGIDEKTGRLKLTTENVAVLQIARDVADEIELDGAVMKLNSAADGLLPGVFYEKSGKRWYLLSYDDSRKFAGNPDLNKRHNLQGPIDDAFMEAFVCVKGTGTPWSKANHQWAMWTLKRFDREFDKWLRGKIPVVNDTAVTEEMIQSKNLILFGDPGSNAVLAKVLAKLPVQWTKDGFTVKGKRYDPATHGLSLIYPNPLNPRKYIVINSGHTMHERDFKASNAWLFPKLGDIAVQKLDPQRDGSYKETVEWAGLFNGGWRLP